MFYDKKVNFKKIAILFGLIFAIVVFGIVIYSYLNDNVEKYILKGNGRIEGREIAVATKFAGKIVEIKVDEGDTIKKGELLLSLDDRSLAADIEAQKAKLNEIDKNIAAVDANIVAIKSDIKFFGREINRTKTLMKQNFSSQFELDKNNNSFDKVKAQLNALEANKKALEASHESLTASIESMEINLNDMKIYSPSDGVILYRLVENGEIVGQGGKLFIMYNPDDLYMTIYMNSQLAGQVKLGDEALIKLDAFKDKVFPAKVTFLAENAEFTPKEVETQVEREKLVFRVKLRLKDNFNRVAKPGMPGESYIKLKDDIDLVKYIE